MTLEALKYAPTTAGRVHKLGFGWLNVGGQLIEHDRILHRDGISAPWWRRRRHHFGLADLREIEATYAPDVVIVGRGWMGMLRIDHDIYYRARSALWSGRTPEAVQRYQTWSARGIDCVACLHMTC